MTQGRLTKRITGAALGAIVLVGAAGAGVDMTQLPPDPAEVNSILNSCSISIIDAAKKAESESGGRLSAIEMVQEGDETLYQAVCFTESEQVTMVIDAETGAVVSREAISSALPGDPVDGLELHKSESGLMWYDLKVGDGPMPISAQTKVTVHYTGWFVDGSKFDSSVDRGKPATFALSGVIRGWTEGVGSMRTGGKRKLLIPGKLAYGPRGRPGIPPSAFLVFDVELIETHD